MGTHTFDEGGDWDRLRQSVRSAVLLTRAGDLEVLVAHTGAPDLAARLQAEFAGIRLIDASGCGYDGAKMKAVRESSGRFVLFLDSDCIPSPDWHERLLSALRQGAAGCGGFTRYEGGFLAALASVQDFGFLLPRATRALKCYASNNCGFRRETLEAVPIPEGFVRCRCFFHAQLLARRGTPVILVPEAQVLHEVQPLVRERSRQGYDVIAACWTDPDVPEARWLRFGVLSLPLFYAARVLADWQRVLAGGSALGLTPAQVALSLPVFPVLRLLDAAGMLRALVGKPRKEGWGGWHPRQGSVAPP